MSELAIRITQGLNKLGLAMKTQEWAAAAGESLTPTQGQTLVLLLRQGPKRLSQVAEELGITPATMSEAVGSLVHKGLVSREKDEADARARILELTETGRARAQAFAQWPDFLAEVVDTLSEAEQQVLLTLVVKMIRKLQEEGLVPVARLCVSCSFFRPNAHPGQAQPHHCDFVNAAFGDRLIRVDCTDFQKAPGDENWNAWMKSASLAQR